MRVSQSGIGGGSSRDTAGAFTRLHRDHTSSRGVFGGCGRPRRRPRSCYTPRVNALVAGTVIAGRYAIVRPLGRGATKQVYLADDRLFGSQVALALLIQEQGGDPTLAARFSREGRAASVLRSPFV